VASDENLKTRNFEAVPIFLRLSQREKIDHTERRFSHKKAQTIKRSALTV